jgi:hypothetical protein
MQRELIACGNRSDEVDPRVLAYDCLPVAGVEEVAEG